MAEEEHKGSIMATTQVSHGESTRQYWMIGAILAVITIVEVIVSLPGVIYSPEDPDITRQLILVPILLVLSAVKGSMVVTIVSMRASNEPKLSMAGLEPAIHFISVTAV